MIPPRANDITVRTQVDLSNSTGKPLYLILIATKPCYIKLASLILALEEKQVPYLAIDTGQHFEKDLVNAREELQYEQLVSVYLHVRGGMLERTGDLAEKINWLGTLLQNTGLRMPAIPVVSGDTYTAGMFPLLWYLKTSIRSIHVEAGLRSYSPFHHLGASAAYQDYIDLQRSSCEWRSVRDDPFPEGIDTRLASLCSQLYLAPVSFNEQRLLEEGVSGTDIRIVGSLSADAVALIRRERIQQSIFEIYPFLSEGKWLRVDLHRRENMDGRTLQILFEAMQQLGDSGVQIILVLSNALSKAIQVYGLQQQLATLQRKGNIRVTPLWPLYHHVMEFLASSHCLGVYTDSGGLQEETQIMDIPCITCRFSTDRPETILQVHNNLLVPPVNATFIYASLLHIFSNRDTLFSNQEKQLYQVAVGDRIAGILQTYVPVASRVEQDIFEAATV